MPEGENTGPGQERNGRQDSEQTMEENRNGSGQDEKGEDSLSVPPDGRNTTMSQGSGKDHMDQIGKGMPGREDALNGMQTGQGHGDPADHIGRMMNSMEQDVSSSLADGMNAGQQGELAGRPLDTGGSIFKDPAGSASLEGKTAGSGMPSGMERKKDSRETTLGENRNGKP